MSTSVSLRVGLMTAMLAAACTASFGGLGGPDAGISGAIAERDPDPSAEGQRQQTLRDELRRLFLAEERYYADQGTYTDEIFHLIGDSGSGFRTDGRVRFSIPEAHTEGFSAIAGHAPFECALFVGEANPPRGYVSIPGVIECR